MHQICSTHKKQQLRNPLNQYIQTMFHDQFLQYFRQIFDQSSNPKHPFRFPNFLKQNISSQKINKFG